MASSSAPTTGAGTGDDSHHPHVGTGDIFTLGLNLKPSQLLHIGNATRNIGKDMAKFYKSLGKTLDRVFHFPFIENHFSDQQEKKITEVVSSIVQVAGFGAAGVAGALGVVKIVSKKSDKIRRVEGMMDIATAGVIATTMAGLGLAPMILAPVAASLGALRGGLKFHKGYVGGDDREAFSGALDSTRSVGTVASRLGGLGLASGVLGAAGAVLGTAAGGLQLIRGFYDVSRGLKAQSNSREVGGLTDMGIAAGMLLAATGVGAVPAIALTATCVVGKLLYSVSKGVRHRVDPVIDKLEPALAKGVHAVEWAGKPLLKLGRLLIDAVTGWHHGSHPPGEPKQNKKQAGQAPPLPVAKEHKGPPALAASGQVAA